MRICENCRSDAESCNQLLQESHSRHLKRSPDPGFNSHFETVRIVQHVTQCVSMSEFACSRWTISARCKQYGEGLVTPDSEPIERGVSRPSACYKGLIRLYSALIVI